MIAPLRNVQWKEALTRILVDFLTVHICMLLALAISVTYRTARGGGIEAEQLIGAFSHYYVAFFLVLSPIFPVAFIAQGFYTCVRGYPGRRKARVVVRGMMLAVGAFLAADHLLFQGAGPGRSVTLPFVTLVGVGICAPRLIRALLDRYPPIPGPQPAPKHVLVVGGAGFIGSLFVERLLQKGYKVRVLDTLVYDVDSLRQAKMNPDFELIVGDCRNIQDVVKAVRGVDSIVQLAAIVGDPACEQDHTAALEINYAATRMLIEIAKGHGVSRLIFASSCSVYGATDAEVDEQSPVRPVSFYGRTKVDSERALLESGNSTFHPTILRFATVFGLSNRPRFDLVVNLLSAKAAQEGVITIYNGRQWRPFIHVRDLAECLFLVLESPAAAVAGQILNVGDSRLNYTLAGVAEVIAQAFPGTRVEHLDNADSRNYRVSFRKIENVLGFRARYSLQDGVDELKSAFADGSIADYTDLRYHNQRFLLAAGGPGQMRDVDAKVMAAFSGPPLNGHAASLSAAGHA